MQSNEHNSSSLSPRQRASVVIGDYELGSQIGKGSFATVYKGLNKRTSSPVAVKSVIRSSLTRRLLENLETEINILRTVKHPNVVELIDCLKSRNHIHLIMEYCALGDLASYMRKRRDHPALRNEHGGLALDIVRSFVRQLGQAMRFLRSRDVIHRDIKTQNILLQPPPGYVMGESEALGVVPEIKIADFGFARNLPSSALAETLCGSPLYMAPEILHYEPYDAKADLWSIGAVVYEMLAGKQPFHASNHVELARIIERTNDNIVFPDEQRGGSEPLDPVLKHLVRGLLKMNPAERMSFEDFFAHPALKWPGDQGDAVDHQADRYHHNSVDDRHQSASDAPAIANIVTAVGNMAINSGAAENATQQRQSPQTQPQQQQRYPPNARASVSTTRTANANTNVPESDVTPSNSHLPSNNRSHQRRSSMAEEAQALAEREYVVIERRALEMNLLADELESSPRTPVMLYPPRALQHQAPGVARQMTALARAIHQAVSPQHNISTEAANGPINNQPGSLTGNPGSARGTATGADTATVFNPLDAELAETFESRHSLGTQQEEPVIRRMEGLAYMAYAMCFLADMKWRLLPPSATPGAGSSGRVPNAKVDALSAPDGGYLSPSDISIEEAFVLYLRSLSLLHCAMREASRYWAEIHRLNHHHHQQQNRTATVTVSAAFNNAVQWVRAKFNQCLDRAEALKQLANGHELDNVAQVSVVQVLYEQALALGKVAAMRELKWIDPLDCDRAYQLAIWMLSAILETTTDAQDGRGNSDSDTGVDSTGMPDNLEEEEEMDLEDRTIVEQFIASIVKRREKLQRKLLQQE
ncbi:Serine/threonine-protein kinase [Coemansia sp. Benny D115]|nr:Serine/threonine-protein kinase [Coemansia sp. Benny D115]